MHRLASIVLALIVALAARLPMRAQEPAANYIVRSWQSEDGLPGNSVRSVAQSADGYLWVATAEGVVRFDGARFAGFDVEPDATLARLPPRTLFALADGDVWIATVQEGLLRWRGGRLASVWDDTDNVVTVPVTQVMADAKGGVFIVRGAELWHAARDGAPQRIERTPELDASLRADADTSAEHGRFFIGKEGPHLRDRAGRWWRVTGNRGLTVTEPGGAEYRIVPPSRAPADRIVELHEDREGSIWVATGESGLLQIRERRVDVIGIDDGLRDRTAFALLTDREGALWVAAKSGGLDRVSSGNVTHFDVGDGSAARAVSALCEDHLGTLWAAARNGSVFRWEEGGFRPLPASLAAAKKVLAIAEDASGALWFGGVQGLNKLSQGQLSTFTAANGFTAREVSALACDAAGNVWVGTGTGAVFRGGKDRFELLDGKNATTRRRISALLPAGDGSLWVATLGSGLLHWRGGRFYTFGESEGLPDPRLTTVLDDGTGNLWLGSLGGIFRVSKQQLDLIERDRATAADWLRLDRSDGLLSRECTGGFQPAGWREPDGTLWFPTVNGVARIRPAELQLNTVPPPVFIEETRANGHVLTGPSMRAGPGRTRLEFRYTALSFAPPEKVRFRVWLDGLDTAWRDVGGQRTIAYEAVPPGAYHFRVRAANGDGVWSVADTDVAVEVVPHFWETPWFRALGVVLALAAAIGIGWRIARARARRRLARLELQTAREKERARIARDLHDDLGASLTEISMLANLAAEDDAAPPAVREPLAQIAGKAQTLVGALDEIVWAVNPRHDTLASVADYLPAVASEFLDSTDITLRLDVARDLPPIALDAERRHGLFLAVRESLNNAVKHSGAREILLRLRAADHRLEIELSDDGRGFDATTQHAGEGLRNLRERMIALGGDARIESIPGTGTSVRLSLPLP